MDTDRRIFFFDIDGTLYDPERKDLPPSTQRALELLFDAGHQIYIATSRGEYEMENVRAALSRYPFHGYIYAGGTITRRAGRVVDVQYMLPRDAERIMDHCGRNGILTRWQTDSGLYFSAEPKAEYRKIVFDLFGEVPGVRPWAGEPLLRLLAYASREQAEQLRALTDGADVMPLSRLVIDVMRSGVTKGSAMLRQAEREGFPISRVVAFGDNDNDADMVARAGVGSAMGNGSPGVKRCADYVTRPVCEGGIFQACRHFGWI